MNKKIKVLFLSSRLPYPPVGGDRLKNHWLLKILSRHFKVHLVSIAEEPVPEEFFYWAKKINLDFKIFYKKKPVFILNALKGVFSGGSPIQVSYYYFRDVKDYIKKIYSNFDLIWATLIRTAKYVIELDKPKVLDMADSIGLNYQRSAEKTTSLFWKIFYKIESKRLLNFEKKCIEKFDRVLFFNPEERAYFKNPEKTRWIPHGVNEALLEYEKKDEHYRNFVAFFGKMDYQPNIDAVIWFAKNVLPLLKKEIKFIVVGARPTRQVLKLTKNPRVVVTGYVEDPYLILKSCLCVVAPMQTGGGIQNKILETMALGTINIISSLAGKPIQAKHGEHYFVIDSPEEIAMKIHEIYENPEKFEMIKKNAREFIKKHFTWSIYEREVIKVIREVLQC